MGLYISVVIGRSRASNRSGILLWIYASRRAVCFEKFLELFAAAYPLDLQIIQLDNGGFHSWLNLNIPENVILLFGPAYSPEVNPIERLWGYIKEQLKWLRFDGIEELRDALQKELKKLTNEVIASLTGYPFILKGLSVANI